MDDQRRESAKYSARELAIEWNECRRKFNMNGSELFPLVLSYGYDTVHDGLRAAYRESRVERLTNSYEVVIYLRGYCEAALNPVPAYLKAIRERY